MKIPSHHIDVCHLTRAIMRTLLFCLMGALLAACQSNQSSESSPSESEAQTQSESQSSASQPQADTTSDSATSAPNSPSSSSTSSSANSSQSSAEDISTGAPSAEGASSSGQTSSSGGVEMSEHQSAAGGAAGDDTKSGARSDTVSSSSNSANAGGAYQAVPTMGQSGSSAAVLSDEEAMAILDRQLNDSIAEFDGMIMSERAATQAVNSDLPEDDSAFGDDNPLFKEGDIGEDSDHSGEYGSTGASDSGGGLTTADTSNSGGSAASSSQSGVNSNRPGAPLPKNIPDGSDDDIVARQIREAATKEQNPELREKLWEEYRKYKQGQ